MIERVVEHYPKLNRDWLIAGALLQDIGKTEELTASRRLGYRLAASSWGTWRWGSKSSSAM